MNVSVVYFVCTKAHIKIGVTSNLGKRLHDLSVASAENLELLAVIPGDAQTERLLHLRFKDCRVRGEWFRPSKSLRLYLLSLGPALNKQAFRAFPTFGEGTRKKECCLQRDRRRPGVPSGRGLRLRQGAAAAAGDCGAGRFRRRDDPHGRKYSRAGRWELVGLPASNRVKRDYQLGILRV